ncbi:MAG: nucleotidyltransferase domain-containing protein [Candidatus Micrarchaeota archaeon]|nr:nucleotidyltransferase domain-containing protein [Candidatus Micrarchaeota archaeon]
MQGIELIKYAGSIEVFLTLLKFPKRQFTIRELAKTAKTPFSSTQRLVKKWERAGIIETGKTGRSVTVKFHDSAYTRMIAKLVKGLVTPQRFTVGMLKKALRKTPGVREVFLFGSVAKGTEKLESDIDLAMLTDKGFDAAKLMFDTYGRYGTKVIPLLFHDKKEFLAFLSGKETVRLV